MRQISKSDVQRKVESVNDFWATGKVEDYFSSKPRRYYFDLFADLAKNRTVNRAIVLMGPRRVGKTVMLWQLIDQMLKVGLRPHSIVYVSLDDPVLHPFSLAELLDIFTRSVKKDTLKDCWVIFDEIQYLKDWDVQLKVLVDTHKKTRFIVSGSAASALSRQGTESGAGRFSHFILPPLTFCEYLKLLNKEESLIQSENEHTFYFQAKDIDALNREFVNYLNYGGFPEAIFSEAIQADPGRFIKHDILDKVLLRDLPSVYGIRDTQELNRIFATLAYQTGQELRLEDVCTRTGLPKNTLKKYIEYLEAAFLIRSVRRVDRTGKSFKRNNFFKIYLTNPSIYASLYGLLNPDEAAFGHLTETAIFAQYFHQETAGARLFYGRWDGGKGEVDLVEVDERFRPVHCVEVKWSDGVVGHTHKLKAVLQFCRDNSLEKAVVTTKTIQKQSSFDQGTTIYFWPSAIYCYLVGKLHFETEKFIGDHGLERAQMDLPLTSL
ncbi:MAG: ATP-binding protein [Opitutales bacterium]